MFMLEEDCLDGLAACTRTWYDCVVLYLSDQLFKHVTKFFFFFQKSQKFGKFEKKLNPGSEKIGCDA